MIYSVLDPITNIVIGRVTNAELAAGRPVVAGEWPIGTSYLRDGQVIPLPSKPGPGVYQWDKQSYQWVIDLVATAQQARITRDQLLTAVDRVNALWLADLTVDQQAELADYRRDLLAVPQQPGFPETITWPTKPRWL